MFWRLILTLLITTVCNGQSKLNESPEEPARAFVDLQARQQQCLTDHMTDVQEWVDKHGHLTSVVDPYTTIDASSVKNITSMLPSKMIRVQSAVRFLSLAHCKLNRVPAVFLIKDTSNRSLADTLEYVTFYGNRFTDISSPGGQYDVKLTASNAVEMKMDYEKPVSSMSAWAVGFYKIKFTKLLELDMRKCSIETLNANIFQEMPNLQALYLSDNNITTISPNAFFGLHNLVHLDLSRNFFKKDKAMIFQSENVFRALKRLSSLDLSYTKLANSNVTVFTRLNKNFESISLCLTGIPKLNDGTFMNTSLRYIDVSGNNEILKNKVLKGTEETMRIIIAENVGLETLENFENFTKLEILNLNHNDIFDLYPNILKTLSNLKILDLTGNRLTTWFHPVVADLDSSLMYLSIKDNYINLITNEMLKDFSNLKYLALSGNFIVCNCNVRELYELAFRNERNSAVEPLRMCEDTRENKYTKLSYNAAYNYFNNKIINRNKVNRECNDYKSPCKEIRQNLTFEGDYVLIDYDLMSYSCMLPLDGKAVYFHDEDTCHEKRRWADVDELLNQGRYEVLILIIIPALILPILIFLYVFRKNFKYCFVTIRNSALLSLINKDDIADDGTIFNYDVFVSYCNDDREWVLDQLLPHVEKDCNISVCLHERDFQVGLSILENIVSCMDRSRSIMLIISKQFLLSQWCQFEMHLAQHRLLETRREDLILVLLEEIPRRARPTTLHYLMLTKTYIVWPKSQEEEAVFWRRLKKSLVTYRLKQPGNESLA